MKAFLDLRLIFIAGILSVATSLPFLSTATEWRDLYFFDVTLTASVQGHTQVFWDFGQGITEADSSSQPLAAQTTPRRYRFMLPTGTIRRLRFDMTDRAGTSMTIADAQIVDWRKHVVMKFPPQAILPVQDLESFEIRGQTIALTTKPTAQDPQLELSLSSPIDLPLMPGPRIKRVIPITLSIFVISLLIGEGSLLRILQKGFGRATLLVRRYPTRSLAGAATIAVVIQTHPVIFFGRSFASPNNGSLMLYEDLPTLPGAKPAEYEDGLGSDVGAFLFQHLYYPIAERDALIKHGEWPLWNRYNLAGLPLLGQGQTMFGDPFNLITIFADGAAWAWDIRFIIARWLLCAGLGFTAYRLTRHLGASLLTTIAAGFLGFFSFRLNHPANFSVCYSPWILWVWVAFIQAETTRKSVYWAGALLLANWVVINSGTVKEAYMIAFCLNLAGLFLLFAMPDSRGRRKALLSIGIVAGAILILLSAPLWMSFLVALKHSITAYDTPTANSVDMRQFIGFFEEIFYRQNRLDEGGLAPSLNFLYFLGFLWWITNPRLWLRNPAGLALTLSSLIPFSFAFGVIPSSVVTKIPFIANIAHTGNTFSCPLMILVALLAAFGFRDAIEKVADRQWYWSYAKILIAGLLLAACFFYATRGLPTSAFFRGYSLELALVAMLLPLCWRWSIARNQPGLGYVAVLLCIPLLLWRHSQYVKSPFDRYVFNPGERLDIHAPSPAVALVNESRTQPGRVVGWNQNLYPAYNTVLGWEGLYGVDAVRSKYYQEFCVAGNLERVWIWDRAPSESAAPDVVPVHDLLNVTHYLATHQNGAHSIAGLRLIGQRDLDVFESPTAWPRAFFTDRVVTYNKPEEIIARLRRPEHPPFAALERGDETLSEDVNSLMRTHGTNTSVPARDYTFTSNKTAFSVDAPRAGIIVLTEVYYPGDFRVTVNGQTASYLRVNHAFKGIYVPAAGQYRVEFAYWPEHFTLALMLGATGGVALLLCAWLLPNFCTSTNRFSELNLHSADSSPS